MPAGFIDQSRWSSAAYRLSDAMPSGRSQKSRLREPVACVPQVEAAARAEVCGGKVLLSYQGLFRPFMFAHVRPTGILVRPMYGAGLGIVDSLESIRYCQSQPKLRSPIGPPSFVTAVGREKGAAKLGNAALS